MRIAIIFWVSCSLLASAQAQWMKIGASQADFRRSVSGMKKVGDKFVNVGLMRSTVSMDSLITRLKKQYKAELTRQPASDSMQLVYLERLHYCYQQHPQQRERSYQDSLLYYYGLQRQLARRLREADIVQRSYSGQIRYFDQYKIHNPLKVNLLKEWVRDYQDWIKTIGITSYGDSPHLLLADYYATLRDDSTALRYVREMLTLAQHHPDRWHAQYWLGIHYFSRDMPDQVLPYLLAVVENPVKTIAPEQLGLLMNAYLTLTKVYIEKKQYDKALSLLPMMNREKYYKNATPFDANYTTNALMIEADVHLKRQQPEKALPLLQKIDPWYQTSYWNKKNYNPRYDLLWYEYYRQTGQTAKALGHLEVYQSKQDSINKAREKSIAESQLQNQQSVRTYEALLLTEKADKERLLQAQQLAAVRKQSEIDRLKATQEKNSLLAHAQQIELERQLENQNLRLNAQKVQQRQESQIRELKISDLSKELALENRTRNFLMGGLALLVLGGVILLWFNTKLKKQNFALSQKNREITEATLRGQTTERKRVATELHDNVNSILASVKASLQTLSPNDEKEHKTFENVMNMVESATQEVRHISHNMLPTELEKEGLENALQALIIRLNLAQRAQFNLCFNGIIPPTNADVAFNLYAICAELCHNIQKHAEATEARIEFEENEGKVALFVSDNGKGFDKTQLTAGMGLKNVYHRAKAIGAELRVQSHLGEGTTFYLIL